MNKIKMMLWKLWNHVNVGSAIDMSASDYLLTVIIPQQLNTLSPFWMLSYDCLVISLQLSECPTPPSAS